MGVLVEEELVATVAHCLPKDKKGRTILPGTVDQGETAGVVRVDLGRLDRGYRTLALVVAVDPCSDLAVLSHRTFSGSDLPPDDKERFFEFSATHVPARILRPEPSPEPTTVRLLSHEGEWVEGVARGSGVTLDNPKKRIKGGTSGSPVFDDAGRVLGLVSTGDTGAPTCQLSFLSDGLPGWVLDRIRRRTRPMHDTSDVDSTKLETILAGLKRK